MLSETTWLSAHDSYLLRKELAMGMNVLSISPKRLSYEILRYTGLWFLYFVAESVFPFDDLRPPKVNI